MEKNPDFENTIDLDAEDVEEILVRIQEQIEKQQQKLFQVVVQGSYFVIAKDVPDVVRTLTKSGFAQPNEYNIYLVKPAERGDVTLQSLHEIPFGGDCTIEEFLKEKVK